MPRGGRDEEKEEGRDELLCELEVRRCSRGEVGPMSLNMWTVSVAEETQRREEVALKDIL